jgi:hypothetical protein
LVAIGDTGDSDTAAREVPADLQFTAQSFHEVGQSPHVHVGAALQLRNGGLVLVEDYGQDVPA